METNEEERKAIEKALEEQKLKEELAAAEHGIEIKIRILFWFICGLIGGLALPFVCMSANLPDMSHKEIFGLFVFIPFAVFGVAAVIVAWMIGMDENRIGKRNMDGPQWKLDDLHGLHRVDE